ncbi:MAG: hypothetical protein KF819_13425 [Labilithrix sp.]|nr:hypothetical protein [Labilithrix sp.]
MLAPSRVRAEPDGVVFHWSRDSTASACASPEAMTDEVARRLGASPFARDGSRSLEGFVERRDGAYRVRLVLRDAGGAVAWTRELASRDADCAAATQAAALAVAALLAPEVEAARLEPPDAADASDATDAAQGDGDAGVRTVVRAPIEPRDGAPETPKGAAAPTTLELLVVTGGGLLPSPSPGLDVGATRVLRGPLRLELGAMWLSSVRTESERFGFGLVAARVGLCGESASTRLSMALCARALVGVVHGTVYELSPSRPGERAWLGASFGPQIRVQIAGPLVASGGGGVVVNLLRYEFVNAVGGRDLVVFEQPILGVEARVGLGLAFP